MKFKTNKLSLNLVLASSLLAASIPAFAVTGDTDQPIHIESDQQSLDMQGNVVTFTGNVIVTQGTIKINADKVVVTRPGGEQGKEVIDGYGKPATFYQMHRLRDPRTPWYAYLYSRLECRLSGQSRKNGRRIPSMRSLLRNIKR